MPGSVEDGNQSPGRHIELVDDNPSSRHDGDTSPGIVNSKGWDGKLRIPKSVLITNPEALSDPDYSDDENVAEGEELEADDRTFTPLSSLLARRGTPVHH